MNSRIFETNTNEWQKGPKNLATVLPATHSTQRDGGGRLVCCRPYWVSSYKSLDKKLMTDIKIICTIQCVYNVIKVLCFFAFCVTTN